MFSVLSSFMDCKDPDPRVLCDSIFTPKESGLLKKWFPLIQEGERISASFHYRSRPQEEGSLSKRGKQSSAGYFLGHGGITELQRFAEMRQCLVVTTTTSHWHLYCTQGFIKYFQKSYVISPPAFNLVLKSNSWHSLSLTMCQTVILNEVNELFYSSSRQPYVSSIA